MHTVLAGFSKVTRAIPLDKDVAVLSVVMPCCDSLVDLAPQKHAVPSVFVFFVFFVFARSFGRAPLSAILVPLFIPYHESGTQPVHSFANLPSIIAFSYTTLQLFM